MDSFGQVFLSRSRNDFEKEKDMLMMEAMPNIKSVNG